MCGICGFAAPASGLNQDALAILQRMNGAMIYRGPDEEGVFLDSKVGLGSRRLSIIDLAGGQQPIPNEDKTLWIVLNGEIYNYRDLHAYLEKRGHHFRTQSDTETILHLYEEFGIDCVQHMDGIFAFAIWDGRKNELIMVRDRMGIKPFYYTVLESGELVFGSEMKVVLAHPDVHRDIDLIALNEFLSYEYVPTPRTIIRNIFRLEAGQVACFNSQGLHKQIYEHLSFKQAESRPPVDWRDYASGFYHVLRSAVQRELVSDVPVGVLLSGGIDSSTLACLMVELYPNKVDSFSIGFENSSFDETHYARQMAKLLGTQHHEMILTSQMAVELVEKMPSILDEPFADSSFIPTYLLSWFAHQKVKVVLGGDGGDELFAGYPTVLAHRLIKAYERLVPWSLRAYVAPYLLDRLAVSFENISLDFRLRRFLSGRNVPLLARHQRWLGSFIDDEKALLFQDWVKPVLRETYYQSYAHAKDCDAQEPLNQVLYNDLKMYLEGDILFKVDRASMANSLEVRVPLLNREVVHFANQLPFNLKLHGLTSKYILKKAMRKQIPAEIIRRPKKGFNMPVAHWLTTDLKNLMLDILSETTINRQGLFNYPYVHQLIQNHLTHRKDNRKLLWTLLMFQMWYGQYME